MKNNTHQKSCKKSTRCQCCDTMFSYTPQDDIKWYDSDMNVTEMLDKRTKVGNAYVECPACKFLISTRSITPVKGFMRKIVEEPGFNILACSIIFSVVLVIGEVLVAFITT